MSINLNGSGKETNVKEENTDHSQQSRLGLRDISKGRKLFRRVIRTLPRTLGSLRCSLRMLHTNPFTVLPKDKMGVGDRKTSFLYDLEKKKLRKPTRWI
ncbi:hypothetical protein Tco_1353487 [Tanacetum coccineum]